MDVVAHLLAAVAEHRVGRAHHGAAHEIREEAVERGARVTGAGETATTKDRRAHAEVASVLLHHDVGRDLRCAEHAVERVVDRHILANAARVRVLRIDLPPLLELD